MHNPLNYFATIRKAVFVITISVVASLLREIFWCPFSWFLAIFLSNSNPNNFFDLPPTGCQNATTKGTDYNGMVNTTKSGRTCQAWNSNYPHKPNAEVSGQVQNLHGNPCRNPNNSPFGLWCYTTDPEKRWEECDVPTCTSGKSLCFNN